MPYSITTRDGITIQNIPDDVAPDAPELKERVAKIRAGMGAQQPAQPQVSERVGRGIMELPRQAVGLPVRYAAEGLASVADIVADPIRQLLVNPGLRALGLPQATTLREAASNAADAVGLPSPETPDERAVADASRTMAAGGGIIGGAGRLAGLAQAGTVRNVLAAMTQAPGVQTAGAAGAGLAGGAVREAGGGPWEQFAAALVGGLTAGGAAGGAVSGAERVVRALTPKAVQMQRADREISLIMQRSGIDWARVHQNVKTALREEVAQALNTGQPLNPDAVRRLAAYQRTGTTPTVGQLSQDPGVITREQNLARMAANSQDEGLQRLPALTNKNTARLLMNLDEMGAARAPESIDAGRAAISSLQAREASAKSTIDALYERARDSSGRSLPLEGGTFTRRASDLIDEAMAGDALPKSVEARLNDIAAGKYPLTVASAEALKTRIGKLQRQTSDGNTRYALGLVRQALDETPLQNGQAVNPGNMPAVPGTVPPSVAAGDDAIAAFNAARSANRQWMQQVESNPALKAVVDGVEPDKFVDKFIVSQQASVADVRKLRAELSPGAVQAVRQNIVRQLKDAATNNTDDVVKFSNSGYRSLLRRLGDEKLRAFFSAEEIDHMKAVGEVAKLMQAQPAGSAINNSNSGTMLMGRGVDVLDKIAGYVPLGGRDIIRGFVQGQQQQQLLTPTNALVRFMPPQRAPINPLLVAPVLASEEGR